MATLKEFTEAIIFIDRSIKQGDIVKIKDKFLGNYPVKTQVQGVVKRVYKAEKVVKVDWRVRSGNSWKVMSGMPESIPLAHIQKDIV